MPERPASQDSPPPRLRLSPALTALAVAAAVALLARRADGSAALPIWAQIALQAPALLAWCHRRCGWFGLRSAPRSADLWLTLVVAASAAGLALSLRRLEVFFTATSAFIIGMVLVDALSRLYRDVDGQLSNSARLLRRLAGPWLLLILAVTILLSLPLATHSAVPDYRHNFWDHVLNNAFSAASAASLVGPTIYGFGTEYSLFGQAVLIAAVQLAGLGFTAVGLATFLPFLWNNIRLRTVIRVALGLQALGIVAMWSAWRAPDVTSAWDRFWWGLVHAAGALSNCGLMMRNDGLAPYIWTPTVFASITTLAIIGSLGLPLILDLVLGQRRPRKNAPKAGRPLTGPPPWYSLPQWEAGLAFALLLGVAFALWFCETPWEPDIVWHLPDSWVPARPVDPGSAHLSLSDVMPLPRRWTLAVFVSATLRSAGMQSITVTEGALSWPSYGLLLICMLIGGSACGVAGGLRTTGVLLPLLCSLTRPSRWPDYAARRLLLRRALLFVPIWLAVNAAGVGALALVSAGTLYERVFEGVAAANSAGLSTGLSLHLTASGRLVMIVIMIVGRALPVAYWFKLSRRFAECRRSTHA